MRPYWESHDGETTVTLYQADVLEALRELPAESVQCVVTSPPYYGLRDYGVEGQIGLEATPEEYVDKLVEVFREVRRVLRSDGVLWLNLGDSYASKTKGSGGPSEIQPINRGSRFTPVTFDISSAGLKPKDLIGIPWRVAFALQEDGWWLRCDVIWAKPKCLPESVTDRPTRSHEYVFLLAKNERYFYDADAIREPHSEASIRRWGKGGEDTNNTKYDKDELNTGVGNLRNGSNPLNPSGRNKRSVWWIATEPFPESHFAVFPEELPRLCILAGTSPMACPKCGAPWKRIVGREKNPNRDVEHERRINAERTGRRDGKVPGPSGQLDRTYTIGFAPACTCVGNDGSGKCVVLDPFAGSGTTLLVAQRLGRNSIGIELNPDYCEIAKRRIEREHSQLRLVM